MDKFKPLPTDKLDDLDKYLTPIQQGQRRRELDIVMQAPTFAEAADQVQAISKKWNEIAHNQL